MNVIDPMHALANWLIGQLSQNAIADAGLTLSLILFGLNEVRRARMSLSLLAPPDQWLPTTAREGAISGGIDLHRCDQLQMRGTFPAAATNDGPKGGAIWDLVPKMEGLPEPWQVKYFNPGKDMPYALDGRSCESWTQMSVTLICKFEQLGQGLTALERSREASLLIAYKRQNWRGKPKTDRTRIKLMPQALLWDLKKPIRLPIAEVDVVKCQLVPLVNTLMDERFKGMNLSDTDKSALAVAALDECPFEYVVAAVSGQAFALDIRDPNTGGPVSRVSGNGVQQALENIKGAQLGIVDEVQKARALAVRI